MTIHLNLRVGQVWRSNDDRNFRGVRILKLYNGTGRDFVLVENIITKRKTMLHRSSFRTGVRGWSLEQEAA